MSYEYSDFTRDIDDDEVDALLDAIKPAIKEALKAFLQERADYVDAMARSGAYNDE
jgi:hypothetical protein